MTMTMTNRQKLAEEKSIKRLTNAREAKMGEKKNSPLAIKSSLKASKKFQNKEAKGDTSIILNSSLPEVILDLKRKRSVAAEASHVANQGTRGLFKLSFKGPTVPIKKSLLSDCTEPSISPDLSKGSSRLIEDHSTRLIVGNEDTRTRQFLSFSSEKNSSVCLKMGNRSWNKVAEEVTSVKGVKCELNENAEYRHIGNTEIGKDITHCWTGPTMKVARLQVVLGTKPSKMELSERSREACLKHSKRQKH